MPGKILDYCKCPMPVKTEEDMQGNQIKHAFISTKKIFKIYAKIIGPNLHYTYY